MTEEIVALCMEDTPGYPDPLIYTLSIPKGAPKEDIKELVLEERLLDLGEEFEEELRENFRVVLVWRGQLNYGDFLLDERT